VSTATYVPDETANKIPGDLNFSPTTFYSPLKNISNAPVETRCPSRILHMKNIIKQE